LALAWSAPRIPAQLAAKYLCLVERHVLEQPAEAECGRADAHGKPGGVEVVGLPSKRRAQPVERAEQMLDLGSGERGLPRCVGHTDTVCGYAGFVGAKTS